MSSPAVAEVMLSSAHDTEPQALAVRFEQSVPVLTVPELLDFEALRVFFREHMPQQAEVIGGRSSRLDLGQREIKLFDLRRLIHLLREEFSVDITGLYVGPEQVQRYAERELKLKIFPHAAPTEPASLDEALPTEEQETEVLDAADDTAHLARPDSPVNAEAVTKITLPNDLEMPAQSKPNAAIPRRPDDGERTLTVRRTLRSGATVRYDGDIYLFGDVNPGAQVIATGNIVVLGALKGMAHAGAAGREDSFILALQLSPTQLRIARKIAIAPARSTGQRLLPEQARIADDQIVIEPYAQRLH